MQHSIRVSICSFNILEFYKRKSQLTVRVSSGEQEGVTEAYPMLMGQNSISIKQTTEKKTHLEDKVSPSANIDWRVLPT